MSPVTEDAPSGPTPSETDAGRPTVICAWCKATLRTGEGPISHGVCPACLSRYFGSTADAGRRASAARDPAA